MIKLIKFEGSWCGPCKALKPIIEKTVSEYNSEDVILESIDIDEEQNQDMVKKANIKGVPTVLVLKKEADESDEKYIVVDKFVGVRQAAEIKKIIDKHI